MSLLSLELTSFIPRTSRNHTGWELLHSFIACLLSRLSNVHTRHTQIASTECAKCNSILAKKLFSDVQGGKIDFDVIWYSLLLLLFTC